MSKYPEGCFTLTLFCEKAKLDSETFISMALHSICFPFSRPEIFFTDVEPVNEKCLENTNHWEYPSWNFGAGTRIDEHWLEIVEMFSQIQDIDLVGIEQMAPKLLRQNLKPESDMWLALIDPVEYDDQSYKNNLHTALEGMKIMVRKLLSSKLPKKQSEFHAV